MFHLRCPQTPPSRPCPWTRPTTTQPHPAQAHPPIASASPHPTTNTHQQPTHQHPPTPINTAPPPLLQEKIRVKLLERANAAREEINRQAEVILRERLGGSDDPELRALADFPRALEVISGLAWQYFKKEWDEVRLCAAYRLASWACLP